MREPSTSRNPAYLLDILNAGRLVQEFVRDMDHETFNGDLKTQNAVIWQLEIVSEATQRVSADHRSAHPEIPWQAMSEMRSRLLPDYNQVNLALIWEVTQNDIPELIAQITPLVPPDEPEQ